MERCICIHGHFYQPPRENPWLEAIEQQDSAYPYHDWNERITVECYAPNVHSRILDSDNRIKKMVNNYARISFDFGPTLLSWLEANASNTYAAILEADRESQKNFSGHGSALAQAYNHVIMPLANSRDKHTQVLWGIRDFEHRFGRKPEGMWVPETAVDLDTLRIMADFGLRFTILAPHQAKRVRKMGSRAWRNVGNGDIDLTMPYELRLPSGRKSPSSFMTRRFPAAWLSKACSREEKILRTVFSPPSARRGNRLNSSISLPTARVTAIITASAIWASLTLSTISNPITWRG